MHPFDLRARMQLAAGGLTGLLDPERDGLMYFLADWRARPPRADHSLWDYGDGSGRHLDALTLLSPVTQAESSRIEAWVIRMLGRHGLSWLPDEPWAKPWGSDALFAEPYRDGETICEISWSQRGALMGLLSRHLRTHDERYLAYCKQLVDGLLAIAEHHPDGLYFPEGYYRPGGWRTHEYDLDPCLVEYNAAAVPVIVRIYETSGYAPALELATGLVDFALKHTGGYNTDGELLVPKGILGSHFHTRSNFVLGVLKLGLADRRPELVDWARSGYTQLRGFGTDFGWFPEGIGLRHGELCCTTDMIELALLLGRHVDAGYFADAERFGRNHLLESQWCSAERLLAAVAALPPAESAGVDSSTSVDVAFRQFGAFASRPGLSDALHLDATAMMQCCNAAGARGLYDLWRYAVTESAPVRGRRQVAIDLRFSVQTPVARVVSHEPAEGRVHVTALTDCDLRLRLPAGCDTACRGGTPLDVSGGGYATFALQVGEFADVRYEMAERTADYVVGEPGREDRARAHWRGETLLRIEPPGRFYPLYERRSDVDPVLPSPLPQPIDSL